MAAWTYSAGSYGNTVTVSERTEGGYIYARWTEGGRTRTKSLKHRSKTRARRYAHELSDKLTGGAGSGSATVQTILGLYVVNHSPNKSSREMLADESRGKRFTEEWGQHKPSDITLFQWSRYISSRMANGAGPRTVEADLKWFNSVLNWASKWATDSGYLLDENPVRGFPIPHEKNPEQPVMTDNMLTNLLKVAGNELWFDLSDLLQIANETGRRLGAIIGLKWEDINIKGRWIIWREDTDKQGKRSQVPCTLIATSILQRRAFNGSEYVFPAPRDKNKPMHRNRAQAWGVAAAKKAGIPWTGWHSIRRKWVSERPATQAVAQAGGWANLRTMLMCYNKPDMESMREAVEQRTPYREAR